MSAMAYRLLVPVRLSGNTSQQRRTTLKSLSSTSIPMLNQTRPAKNSRTSRFQAGVALRTHPLRQNENCCRPIALGHIPCHPSDFLARWTFLCLKGIRRAWGGLRMGGIATVAAAIGADLAAPLPRQNKKQREGLALLVATALDVRDVNLMELAAALP